MRDSDLKRYKLTIRILAIVVVVFALVMAYFFLIRPLTNNYIVEKQTEAQIATYNFIVNDMIAQLQQNGYYQLPIGNETLILVPWQEPQQQVEQ
jgi:hypothetical protein